MDVTLRVKQILLVLLNQNKPILMNDLAKEIAVSKRTVQREFDYLQQLLAPFSLRLISKASVGVWIEGGNEYKETLKNELNSQDIIDFNDKEFRRKSIILELLQEKGLKKIYWYSSKFKVSEATISSDLEASEKWLSEQGLTLYKKPGSGIQLEGSEENYRRAIRLFIEENIHSHFIKEIYDLNFDKLTQLDSFKNYGIAHMLNEEVLTKVSKVIANLYANYFFNFTQDSYMALILHVAIAMQRIKNDETVETSDKWMNLLQKDEDYKMAEALVLELEKEFEVAIPEIEIAYICLHIKGAKHEKILDAQESDEELKVLIHDMVFAFDEQMAYPLMQDEVFVQSLLAHIRPTLIRLQHAMGIHNPILQEIKTEYYDVYHRCIKVAQVVERYCGKPLPEDEIGFLTVHFGSALERNENKQKVIRVVDIGVICSSGIGISHLMASKIKKVFKDQVHVRAYSKYDIDKGNCGNEDFFVSSIKVNYNHLDVIHVNPLLNSQDMMAISNAFMRYIDTPKQQIIEEISFEIEHIHQVVSQIKLLLENVHYGTLAKELSLLKVLQQVSSYMSEDNDSKQQIMADILAREKLFTQIFPEYGFALFHARSQGVDRPLLHIYSPDEELIFTSDELKRIQTIFVMLIPFDEHIDENANMLGYISGQLLDNTEIFEAIALRDERAIKKQLDKMMKAHLSTYIL